MRKMKALQALLFFLTASLLFALAGCGQPAETGKNTTAASPDQMQTQTQTPPAQAADTEKQNAGQKPANSYPDKPLTLIVAYGPGGTDTTARLLAEPLGKELGQPVNVVNVTGGGGWNGWGKLANSTPDGYTIGYINVPNMFNGYLDPKIGIKESLDSFVPIMNHVTDPGVWMVRADSPFKTLSDVIQKLKDKPGSVSIAAHGVGGDDHLGILQVEEQAGVQFNILQNGNGTGESISQLLGGHIDLVAGNVGEALKLVKDGQIRTIGVLSDKRSPFLPDTPTMKEQGYDAITFAGRGISAPKGTPGEITDTLINALQTVLTRPEEQDRYEKMGLELDIKKGEEYQKFLKENEQRIKKLMGW